MMATQFRLWQLVVQVLLFSSIVLSESTAAQDAVQEARVILSSITSSTRNPPSTQSTTISYYAKELFSLLFLTGPPAPRANVRLTDVPLQNALHLLGGAAAQENSDAIYLLAEMNFHGNYSLPRNFQIAFDRYQQLASLTGNASAQHMIGFMYATGIGGVVKQDQAKALLYYTFAAEGGDARAQMTVAYRWHKGISTPMNCEEAVFYYKKVADRAMDYLKSGPPGNHMIVKESYRLADEVGGVYGEGASVSSAGINAKMGGPSSDAHASFEDVVEYLDLMSRKGDLKATFSLAKLYYDGGRGVKRNLRLAREYFLEIARTVWPKKGKAKQEVSATTEKLASKAAGFLGRMFLRGEGVLEDFDRAEIWFKRGVSNGDALSQYSLGLMHLHGYGVRQDAMKAASYFSAAADQDLASAQVRIGVLFLDKGDTDTAIRYFDTAARHGHIEAYYYLAELSFGGIGRDENCPVAAAYYKIVSEKAEAIIASFNEANEAYTSGDVDTALIDFMLAAEQGFEAAQANVAYILDRSMPRLRLPTISSKAKSPSVSRIAKDENLALLHWTRSANQLNIDSFIKMGDYYLAGIGSPTDEEKAASCYQAAAETMHSAQAYWNLGWMHENGIGIEQDFHLAKRFYDLALETNKEAYLPVTLALFKLRARSTWNRWTGGRVKSIEDEPLPRKTWSEWLHAFLEADAALYHDHDNMDDGNLLDDRDDWYGAHPDGTPDGYDELDFDDDGILESVLIIGAATLLAILVMYRRRRQEERERERLGLPPRQPGEANAAAGAQDRGLFPAPGDPGFGGWVAGGIGL